MKQDLRQIEKERAGFTLVEVLIVMFIFSIVSLVAITTYLTTFRVGQRATIENAIIEDSKFILQAIATEIKNGSIDYEEYFSQCVIGGTCPNQDLSSTVSFPTKYGENHGFYAWQFKYGGKQNDDPLGPDDGFGGICQKALLGDKFTDFPDEACSTGPLPFSDDIDTGQNPNYNWQGKSIDEASAFCSTNAPVSGTDGYQTFEDDPTGIKKAESLTPCEVASPHTSAYYKDLASYAMNELYLIDASGNHKTILLREKINNADQGDYALSKIELRKQANAEQDLLSRPLPWFKFVCTENYSCSDGIINPDEKNIPSRSEAYSYNDDENIFLDFVPISPLKVNIKNLKFIVYPVEDPHRAFSEIRYYVGDEPTVQVQPQVTILLEIEPSRKYRLPFISNNFNLTLQTTVTAGVKDVIPIVSES